MIPEIFIENWRKNVNWQKIEQVEQDLIISRALVDLYNNPHIKEKLIFRGGTALNKLFLKPAARYSEDIDFVQKNPEPIGITINAIRETLNHWLGEPKRKITERSVKLIYQYISIDNLPAKLKIEINTTGHFQVLPLKQTDFSISSEWFTGSTQIATYELEELMATKLRDLYQRRKGRDLFDMWYVFNHIPTNVDRVVDIFRRYCSNDGIIIERDVFQQNMEAKRKNVDFQNDMHVLLPRNIRWNFNEAFDFVVNQVVCKIP